MHRSYFFIRCPGVSLPYAQRPSYKSYHYLGRLAAYAELLSLDPMLYLFRLFSHGLHEEPHSFAFISVSPSPAAPRRSALAYFADIPSGMNAMKLGSDPTSDPDPLYNLRSEFMTIRAELGDIQGSPNKRNT